MPSTDVLTHTPEGAAAYETHTPLRVLFLVMGYPSAAWQTIGIFHRTMAEAMQRLGVDVEVDMPVPFVPPGFARASEKWKAYAEMPKEYMMNGIRVHCPRYFHFPRGDYWSMPHLFIEQATRRRIDRRPDIIHAHYAYPSGLAALGLSKAWDVPAILTLHGSDVNSNPLVNRLAMNRFQRAVRGAAHVTTVSRALAEKTREMSGRLPEVIPVGIRLGRYAELPEPKEARRLLGLPAEGTLVLYVGALMQEKGVTELIGALTQSAVPGVRGIVIGDGPLKNEISMHPSILYMGSQPNEKIPLYMKACDMIVLPSYGEGMPTVLVEAGASGLPIIGSRAGGIPELLEEERGFLLEAISSADIRSCIRRVITDPAEARRRSRNMRSFILSHHDADRNAALYAERYRACIECYRRS